MYYIKGSYLYERKAPAGRSIKIKASKLSEALKQFTRHLIDPSVTSCGEVKDWQELNKKLK